MSYTYPGSSILGASKTGLAIGYRLVNLDGTQNTAFTTTNVVETSVSGNYTVTGGISLSDGFVGRIEWGTAGTKYAEEWVGPNVYEYTDVKTSSVGVDVTTLLTRLSAVRAGYLDNLNIGGNVASSTEATSIQNNTRVVRIVPDIIERPDVGTQEYRSELFLYDSVGNMEAPDAAPTIALVNQAGTDLSARLDSVTMSLISTGRYRAVYTAAVAHTAEQLVWLFSVVEGGLTRVYGNTSLIVDTTAADFTSADRTKLDAIKLQTDTIPVNPAAIGSAMTLTVGERNAVATAQLDLVDGIETGLTPRQAMRLLAAALAGKLSGAGTTTITIRNAVADDQDRITATCTLIGSRTAITYDLT